MYNMGSQMKHTREEYLAVNVVILDIFTKKMLFATWLCKFSCASIREHSLARSLCRGANENDYV